MTNNLSFAKQFLEEKNLTLVLYDGKEIIQSTERGIKPLLQLLDSKRDLSSFSAADKVIGKAAAFLYVNLGIKEIFAKTISSPAQEVLAKNKISIQAQEAVPYIINRKKDGMCPMESAVLQISDPHEALPAIRTTVISLARRQ